MNFQRYDDFEAHYRMAELQRTSRHRYLDTAYAPKAPLWSRTLRRVKGLFTGRAQVAASSPLIATKLPSAPASTRSRAS